ncbi:hypothetical protein [Campylobacter showae]|uniref:hypothetical protein n=1 Tax=Campylobacter showae TaxID=204 RepID=UPI00197EC70A|nr:hypothetical protein [Campylobacter showae]
MGEEKKKKGGGLPTVCLQLLACEAETSTYPTAREMLLRYAQVYPVLMRRTVLNFTRGKFGVFKMRVSVGKI